MNAKRWSKIREIFSAVFDADPNERAVLLDQLCVGDIALRADVESLLTSRGRAPDLLETPGAGLLSTVLTGADGATLVGQTIGPYRLTGLIASGGMGSVYQAERDDAQYQKTVAVKLIRRGMADEGSVRRFLIERQTLAKLDHPYIARLLDGGVTPDAMPYLVMDYVKGEPIDRYCDQRHLSTVERLRLFLDVCAAVQYAHQNLIVHRDLKPGNIFITAKGEPRLLDFGIAKMIEPDAPGSSPAITRTRQRLMTPEYASPEQIRGEAITVASDVYSLGVVLYELLSGHRPYRVQSRSAYEIEKAVLEDEPERLSTVVQRVAHLPHTGKAESRTITPESVSATRDGEPARLRRRLRGDLDAIVLTALHKNAQQRYISVEQFATDIRNHLEGLPVIARHNSATQRFLIHAWRNRYAAGAVAAVFVSLVLGIAGITWQRDRALAAGERARQEAENTRVEVEKSRQVIRFLRDTLTAVDPRNRGRDVTMLEVLDQAATSVHEKFGEDPEVETAVRTAIGETYVGLGRYDEAEPQFRVALKLQQDIHKGDHPDVSRTLRNLGVLLYSEGRFEEAQRVCEQALAMTRRLYPEHHAEVAQDLNNLAAVMRALGQSDTAREFYEQCLETRRAVHGDDSLEVAETLNNMAGIARSEGDLEKAVKLLEETLQIRRARLPPHHPLVAQSLGNLGVMLGVQGKLDQALSLLREEAAIESVVLGDDHPDLAVTYSNLAAIFERLDRLAEAEPYLRRSFEIRRANFSASDARVLAVQARLGNCLTALGRFSDAEPLLLSTYEQLQGRAAPDPTALQSARQNLVALYEVWGRDEDADRWRIASRAASQPATAPETSPRN